MSDIGLVPTYLKATSRDGLSRLILRYQISKKRRIEIISIVEHLEDKVFVAWFYERIDLPEMAQAESEALQNDSSSL